MVAGRIGGANLKIREWLPMATVFLDLELHSPDARSTVGGGWIVPKSYSTDNRGHIHLTPHCAGIGEIEWHIDRMQADLEELRKKARRASLRDLRT
jgi:hypothetical protein